jgi:AGZA family xanthine/uracil permease-like MFS transporter
MNRTQQMLDISEHDTSSARPAAGWAERMFKLKEHNTTVRTELVAGLTTFLTMA